MDGNEQLFFHTQEVDLNWLCKKLENGTAAAEDL